MAPKWSALKNIPKEMRVLPQWVCYKAVPREGHWGKIIQSPVTREAAKSNCPSDWTDFETALTYAQSHNIQSQRNIVEQMSTKKETEAEM